MNSAIGVVSSNLNWAFPCSRKALEMNLIQNAMPWHTVYGGSLDYSYVAHDFRCHSVAMVVAHFLEKEGTLKLCIGQDHYGHFMWFVGKWLFNVTGDVGKPANAALHTQAVVDEVAQCVFKTAGEIWREKKTGRSLA